VSKILQTKAVSFSVYSVTEETQFLGLVFLKVMQRPRGEIASHISIEYSLSNISARNYQNWLRCVEVIVCNIRVVFTARGYAQCMARLV